MSPHHFPPTTPLSDIKVTIDLILMTLPRIEEPPPPGTAPLSSSAAAALRPGGDRPCYFRLTSISNTPVGAVPPVPTHGEEEDDPDPVEFKNLHIAAAGSKYAIKYHLRGYKLSSFSVCC